MEKIHKDINEILVNKVIEPICLKQHPRSKNTRHTIKVLKELVNKNNSESRIGKWDLYKAGGMHQQYPASIPLKMAFRLGMIEETRDQGVVYFKLKEYDVDKFFRNLENLKVSSHHEADAYYRPNEKDMHNIDISMFLREMAKLGHDVLNPDDDYSELF